MGVRIPKSLLEQCGLEDHIHLSVVDGGILIEADRTPRAGWAEAAAKAHEESDDRPLEEPVPARFDDTEWEWA